MSKYPGLIFMLSSMCSAAFAGAVGSNCQAGYEYAFLISALNQPQSQNGCSAELILQSQSNNITATPTPPPPAIFSNTGLPVLYLIDVCVLPDNSGNPPTTSFTYAQGGNSYVFTIDANSGLCRATTPNSGWNALTPCKFGELWFAAPGGIGSGAWTASFAILNNTSCSSYKKSSANHSSVKTVNKFAMAVEYDMRRLFNEIKMIF